MFSMFPWFRIADRYSDNQSYRIYDWSRHGRLAEIDSVDADSQGNPNVQ